MIRIFSKLFSKLKVLVLLHMPDIWFLKYTYKKHFGIELDLQNPKTFNQKLQWLKLYDRNPLYTELVDKVKVKEWVAKRIGEEYIIPTLAVYKNVAEIDFDKLPEKFVLKCNHDSGHLFICKDKMNFNRDVACQSLAESLRIDYWRYGREWPYKNVKKKILAEKFIQEDGDEDLKDYKFFCFNGIVHFCKVDFDRYINHRANYYNRDWVLQKYGEKICPPDFSKQIPCPSNFKKMIELAEKLSEGIPFARVDLYNVSGTIYFGEITFFPANGLGHFIPEEADEQIGRLLKLPSENIKNKSSIF